MSEPSSSPSIAAKVTAMLAMMIKTGGPQRMKASTSRSCRW